MSKAFRLQNLRYAFVDAAQDGVTVLGSSGDSGTANVKKEPVKNPQTIPYPTVEWPASDPLVTGVGGTYLCTDPTAATNEPRTITPGPPTRCANNPTPIGSSRGVPDVGLQASSLTGGFVYVSLPPAGNGGLQCSGGPLQHRLVRHRRYVTFIPAVGRHRAIADQLNGGRLGLINPALYRLGSGPTCANDFYDVVGNNQTDPSVPGYSASTGWDPVTGLGTPNAANLVPDLVAASH